MRDVFCACMCNRGGRSIIGAVSILFCGVWGTLSWAGGVISGAGNGAGSGFCKIIFLKRGRNNIYSPNMPNTIANVIAM